MKKEPQIFMRTDVQHVPVDDFILDTLEQEELIESLVRDILVEMRLSVRLIESKVR